MFLIDVSILGGLNSGISLYCISLGTGNLSYNMLSVNLTGPWKLFVLLFFIYFFFRTTAPYPPDATGTVLQTVHLIKIAE